MPRDEAAPTGAPLASPPTGGTEPSGAAVRLRTLGRLELVADLPEGGEVRVLGPSKPLALLAYLALAPRRRATRDRLLPLMRIPSGRAARCARRCGRCGSAWGTRRC